VAGTGVAGYSGDGGPASAAQMNRPVVIAFDVIGNMYIADAGGNRIRKIDPFGIITTVAGNGVAGFSGDGGPATAANLNRPEFVRVDAAANIYISDMSNYRLRKVNVAGIITTIAGNGSPGATGDGGPATAASISPADVAFDTKGNLLVCDYDGNRVRRIDASGIITSIVGNGSPTYAGDGGPATAASIHGPCTLCFDLTGNLLIADWWNYVVRKIDTSGVITTIAGTGVSGYSGDNGPATSAQLSSPDGLITDSSGNIFISDQGNYRIREIVVPIPFTGISGKALFPGVAYYGDVKVWLIKYDPATLILSAVDSITVTCTSGTSVDYAFTGMATDSFRVKAAPYPSMGSFGYLPTYYGNAYYWDSASVILHTSGVPDINKDITLNYGATTSGPGFIGGSVTTGANKGTADGDPVTGLLIFAIGSSGTPVQVAVTDGSGNYSFSNLPLDTYAIFPEELSFNTTAYTNVTITPDNTAMTNVSFTEHTISMTITPADELKVNEVSAVSSLFIFPQPSNGKLNLQSKLPAAEKASVIVRDITGRQVYSTNISMLKGNDINQIDLSALNNGLYLMNVNSAAISYFGKITILK
jgi:type IX secretion system substrate protein/carboxypeptidase family protein